MLERPEAIDKRRAVHAVDHAEAGGGIQMMHRQSRQEHPGQRQPPPGAQERTKDHRQRQRGQHAADGPPIQPAGAGLQRHLPARREKPVVGDRRRNGVRQQQPRQHGFERTAIRGGGGRIRCAAGPERCPVQQESDCRQPQARQAGDRRIQPGARAMTRGQRRQAQPDGGQRPAKPCGPVAPDGGIIHGGHSERPRSLQQSKTASAVVGCCRRRISVSVTFSAAESRRSFGGCRAQQQLAASFCDSRCAVNATECHPRPRDVAFRI